MLFRSRFGFAGFGQHIGDAREAKEALASQLRQIDEAIAQKQAAELTNGTVEDLIKKREAILAGSKPTL